MKHFDLFSGYGGFTLALERAYANYSINTRGERNAAIISPNGNISSSEHSAGRTESPKTIGFSEIDKYASAVLKYHWPNIKNYGDITKINWVEVPDFDLLTGGSPCQDLSIAGKREGLAGQRSGLFFEYMRAVREKKPKYFIWENVKGTLSSNNGRDFSIVLNEMAEAGYSLWWQVLNAKDFGVPQNRERIFVVGFRDESAPEIFFEREANIEDSRKTSSESISFQEFFGSEQHKEIQINNMSMAGPRITNRGYFGTLDNCGGQGVSLSSKIRRLTPTECERLMGLSDNWTKVVYSFDNQLPRLISDSQSYKMCGNGVVVSVVQKIIEELILK